MRVIIWISGVVAGVLLILLLTGVVGAESAVDNALRQGNRHFALAEYEQALSFYETGLADSPDNKQLNFCAAQAAYFLGDYGKAAMYYEKSEDCIEKFLNAGNAAVKLGDMLQALRQAAAQDAEQSKEQGAGQDAEQGAGQDAEQSAGQSAGQAAGQGVGQGAEQGTGQDAEQSAEQNAGQGAKQNAGQGAKQNAEQSDEQVTVEQIMQLYLYALKSYHDGIVAFPQDMSLKYNYELVKKKIDKLLEEQEQQKDNQSGDKGEQQDGEQQDGEKQDAESAENKEGEQDQASESEQKQGDEEEQGAKQEQASESDEEKEGDQKDVSEGEEGDGDESLDAQAIARILQYLESQEEESLKNNREVQDGKAGKYVW